MTQRILFIEDDASGREMGVYNLKKAGYDVDAVARGEEGLKLFSPERHDLLITDIKMPGISGIEVLQEVRKQAPDVPVLVITAYATVEAAVEAIRLGAADFIGKPFNRDHLLMVVEKALHSRELNRQLRSWRIKATGVERPLVYRSAEMGRVVAFADQVARSTATVLITGESGTGKELLARRIHTKSDRAEKPFVVVNAAAMPATLLESELFGHAKGAFTGATQDRLGRFRQADKGTLFLDEVGEIPLSLQAKLLRVLQEQVVEVIGSDSPVSVDVRVIAATNANLRQMVKESQFRDDLLYRLNVLEVDIPPLRERPEDIDALVPHFVGQFADQRELGIPPSLLTRLRTHTWPGNVRELENVCQRLVVLCQGAELDDRDLPFDKPAPQSDQSQSTDQILEDWPILPPDGFSLVDLEKHIIERVLVLKGGNVSQAAVYLKVPRHVLAYRMEKYGLQRTN